MCSKYLQYEPRSYHAAVSVKARYHLSPLAERLRLKDRERDDMTSTLWFSLRRMYSRHYIVTKEIHNLSLGAGTVPQRYLTGRNRPRYMGR